MADNYLSGKDAKVMIGSTTYSFSKWSLDMKTNLPKVTNFTTAGFQKVVQGITSGTLTVSGPYNEGNMAFTSGQSYAWILGFDGTTTLTCTARISSIKADEDVDGSPQISITAETDGSFTAAIV